MCLCLRAIDLEKEQCKRLALCPFKSWQEVAISKLQAA